MKASVFALAPWLIAAPALQAYAYQVAPGFTGSIPADGMEGVWVIGEGNRGQTTVSPN